MREGQNPAVSEAYGRVLLWYYAFMKKQVFYVHGGDSFNKQEDFLQYLQTKTIRDLPTIAQAKSWKNTVPVDLGPDYEVFMPEMPNRHNAHYEEWKIWFERHFEYLRDEIILVGCSLGAMFLAKYLAENTPPFKIAKLYLLAGPGGDWPLQPDGNDCSSFKFTAHDVDNISKTAVNIEIWHSEDDFLVPIEEAYWYQKHLPEAKLRLFKDKNHFLLPDLPELIADIKQFSQN